MLMGKIELVPLMNLSSWCLVMVERLFLTVPRGCLQFVIVVFSDILTYYFFVSEVVGKLEMLIGVERKEALLSLGLYER